MLHFLSNKIKLPVEIFLIYKKKEQGNIFSALFSLQVLHKNIKKMFPLKYIIHVNILALLLLNQSFLLPNGRREVLGCLKLRRELFSIPEQSGGVVGERSEGQPDFIISFLLLCLLGELSSAYAPDAQLHWPLLLRHTKPAPAKNGSAFSQHLIHRNKQIRTYVFIRWK